MKGADLLALREWVSVFSECGMVQAVHVRDLLAAYDSTRLALESALAQVEDYVESLRVKDELILTLMDRVKAQAEILSRKAEVTA